MSNTGPSKRYTPETIQVIAVAKQSVMEYKHTHITPEHILLGLLTNRGPTMQSVWNIANATPDQIRQLVIQHLRAGSFLVPEDQLTFSERAKRVIENAAEEARRFKSDQVAPEHLLIGLTRVSNTVCGAVLRAVELNTESARVALNQPATD